MLEKILEEYKIRCMHTAKCDSSVLHLLRNVRPE